LELIAQAVFLLERGQTDRQTDKQTDATERSTHDGDYAGVGNNNHCRGSKRTINLLAFFSESVFCHDISSLARLNCFRIRVNRSDVMCTREKAVSL